MENNTLHRRWLMHRLLGLTVLNVPVFFVILGLFFTGRGTPAGYYAFLYGLLAAIAHAGFFFGFGCFNHRTVFAGVFRPTETQDHLERFVR